MLQYENRNAPSEGLSVLEMKYFKAPFQESPQRVELSFDLNFVPFHSPLRHFKMSYGCIWSAVQARTATVIIGGGVAQRDLKIGSLFVCLTAATHQVFPINRVLACNEGASRYDVCIGGGRGVMGKWT